MKIFYHQLIKLREISSVALEIFTFKINTEKYMLLSKKMIPLILIIQININNLRSNKAFNHQIVLKSYWEQQ